MDYAVLLSGCAIGMGMFYLHLPFGRHRSRRVGLGASKQLGELVVFLIYELPVLEDVARLAEGRLPLEVVDHRVHPLAFADVQRPYQKVDHGVILQELAVLGDPVVTHTYFEREEYLVGSKRSIFAIGTPEQFTSLFPLSSSSPRYRSVIRSSLKFRMLRSIILRCSS